MSTGNAPQPNSDPTTNQTERIPMTEDPARSTETDRLIQATRDEARKTRVLLAWLLVGIPVLALCIWGLVAFVGWVHVQTPSTSTGDTSVTLSLESTCQQLNTATTDQLHSFDEVWPEVATEADANCTAHPDWTISQAIAPPPTP